MKVYPRTVFEPFPNPNLNSILTKLRLNLISTSASISTSTFTSTQYNCDIKTTQSCCMHKFQRITFVCNINIFCLHTGDTFCLFTLLLSSASCPDSNFSWRLRWLEFHKSSHPPTTPPDYPDGFKFGSNYDNTQK